MISDSEKAAIRSLYERFVLPEETEDRRVRAEQRAVKDIFTKITKEAKVGTRRAKESGLFDSLKKKVEKYLEE